VKKNGGTLLRRTLFVVDEQNLTGYAQTLEEWSADGYDLLALDKVYTYGLDLVAQTQFEFDEQSSSFIPHISYFLYDGHGNVRGLADEFGTVTDTYAYDAFGIQLEQTGATENAYRYCGEQFDSDLGMYFLRARHMNPETGRFWTMDTYEGNNFDPPSLHKYLYCHSDPVNYIDPSGLWSLAEMSATTLISAGLGGLGAGGVEVLQGGYFSDGFQRGFVYGLLAAPVAYTFLSFGFLGFSPALIFTKVGLINAMIASALGDGSVQLVYWAATGKDYDWGQTAGTTLVAVVTFGFGRVGVRGNFTNMGITSILEAINATVSACRDVAQTALDNALPESQL